MGIGSSHSAVGHLKPISSSLQVKVRGLDEVVSQASEEDGSMMDMPVGSSAATLAVCSACVVRGFLASCCPVIQHYPNQNLWRTHLALITIILRLWTLLLQHNL